MHACARATSDRDRAQQAERSLMEERARNQILQRHVKTSASSNAISSSSPPSRASTGLSSSSQGGQHRSQQRIASPLALYRPAVSTPVRTPVTQLRQPAQGSDATRTTKVDATGYLTRSHTSCDLKSHHSASHACYKTKLV